MPTNKIILLFISLFFASLANNAAAQKIDINQPICYEVYDPYESFNRKMFVFNETLDNTILKPMATAYNRAVPSWGRDRVRGFFTNLASPLTFINNLLQGEGDAAVKTFFRFMINSTFGMLGTIDYAKDFGLYAKTQKFGNTFAHYGANYGAYLVLPFVGPSTIRGTSGIPFNAAFNPLNLYLDTGQMFAVYGGEKFTARAEYMDFTASLEASSLDYYAQIRSIYIQYVAKHNPICKNRNQVDYSAYEEFED